MPFSETADRTRLFYKDWGTGKPVVFIHGGQLGADTWEYQMPWLVEHRLRCIAYDRRGCGRSDQPWGGYDYDTFADDLAALVERLDPREISLVGYSNGAGEVARYLSCHGVDRVARAVLLAPITPFLLKTADNPHGVDKRVFDDMVAQLTTDRPGYVTATAPILMGAGLPGNTVSSPFMQWGVELSLQASPKATVAITHAFSETGFRPDMGAFTVPTLVIHGDADPIVPFEVSGKRTAEALPGSRLIVYEGAPHGLLFTHKERFNRDLLAFIQDLHSAAW